MSRKRSKRRKAMKKTASNPMRKVFVPVFLLLGLFFLVSDSSAKEKSNGALILVQNIDGQRIEGELLAVKDTNLVLLDSGNLCGITEDIHGIRTIQILKKSKFFKGLGYGLLIGGGSGALIGLLSGSDQEGFLRFSAGEKALMGGIGFAILGAPIGGIWGAIEGIDETISLEGRSPEEIKRILNKLSLLARFPVELPENLKSRYLKDQKNNQEVAQKPVAALRQFTIHDSLNQTKASSILAKFHFSLLPRYFAPQAIAQYKEFLKSSGFGDTEPAGTVPFFGLEYPAVNYPLEVRDPIILCIFRIEYSIRKKIVLGFESSPLGSHEVHGYRRIDLFVNEWGEQVYSDLFLLGKYRGAVYYFTAAWMPLPYAYLKKSALKVGAGIGLGSIHQSFETSDWEYTKEMGEKRDFSKISLGLKAFCEYDYYFSRTGSLGIHFSYEYLSLKVSRFQLTGYYFNLDASNNLIHDSVTIDFPQQKLNFDGFGAGLSFGLHF
jgi:hypothetical protein